MGDSVVGDPRMSIARPIVFWIATFAVVIAVVILLQEVLLPFVAGMMLAYLLDPIANRLEWLGVNRLFATLAIVALVIVLVIVLAEQWWKADKICGRALSFAELRTGGKSQTLLLQLVLRRY